MVQISHKVSTTLHGEAVLPAARVVRAESAVVSVCNEASRAAACAVNVARSEEGEEMVDGVVVVVVVVVALAGAAAEAVVSDDDGWDIGVLISKRRDYQSPVPAVMMVVVQGEWSPRDDPKKKGKAKQRDGCKASDLIGVNESFHDLHSWQHNL